jgi:hypothetical protein
LHSANNGYRVSGRHVLLWSSNDHPNNRVTYDGDLARAFRPVYDRYLGPWGDILHGWWLRTDIANADVQWTGLGLRACTWGNSDGDLLRKGQTAWSPLSIIIRGLTLPVGV